jgi:hypothetical protein
MEGSRVLKKRKEYNPDKSGMATSPLALALMETQDPLSPWANDRLTVEVVALIRRVQTLEQTWQRPKKSPQRRQSSRKARRKRPAPKPR